MARDYAVGGEARAIHANDEEARLVLQDHPFTRLAFSVMGQRQVLAELRAASVTRASGPNQPADSTPPAAPSQYSLENGLRVRIRPIQGASNVALLLLYEIGGDHDPAGRSGLAHLVEHVYVTAATGATPTRTAEAFFRAYPAGCNAQTGDSYTVFATVFPRGDLDQELTDAAARMGDLRITSADLEREKPRLLAEVANMFGRIPMLGAVNTARELSRPTPRGGRKGGLPEHVAGITVDDVQAYCKRYYKPRNAILVIAGAVGEGSAGQSVRAQFAKIEPGEKAPKPEEPGSPKTGAVSSFAVKSLQPLSEPVACLAYAAPEPESDLYAPFLALVARFWAASPPPGGGAGAGGPSVYFPVLEDPAVLGVSVAGRPGETAPQAIARLESFVADTIAPPLRGDERAKARQSFALFLDTDEIPDFALSQNPYGAALSLARREQLGIDSRKLRHTIDALSEAQLRRAATQIFASSRHAGAFISPGK
jgi:zinc protease